MTGKQYPYYIGEEYKYPGYAKRFTLTETNGMIFRFACGHWCFDSVFGDLIRVKTGVQVYKDLQLKLQL